MRLRSRYDREILGLALPALGALADDPERFLRLSRGAVERVTMQLRADELLAKEMAIIARE